MLSSLEITNIGRVEHEIFEFDMFFKVIGVNGAGKTKAIYDTIEMLMANSDFPFSCVRDGQKSGSATLKLSNGNSVSRTRTKSSQSMTLYNAAKDETKTLSTISDMTAEVRALTGYGEIAFDKTTKENFQLIPIEASQTYLINGVSPENVLRRITKVMGGAGAETAKQKITSERTALRSALVVHQQAYDKLAVRVGEEWEKVDFNDLQANYTKLSTLEASLEAKQDNLDKLAGLIETLDGQSIWLEKVERKADVPSLKLNLTELSTLETSLNKLKSKVSTVENALAVLDDAYKPVDILEQLNLPYVKSQLNILAAHQLVIDNATSLRETVKSKVNALYMLDVSITKMTTELEQAKQKVKEYVPPIVVGAPNTCPTCGQPVLQVAA